MMCATYDIDNVYMYVWAISIMSVLLKLYIKEAKHFTNVTNMTSDNLISCVREKSFYTTTKKVRER